ncbi:MAG: hypothetical protein FWH07_00935 [Oscillospiraceae bacterium]|nr:hypothetical protein [Oscillospiraceae bacterium]
MRVSKQFKYALRHGAVLRYTTFGLVFAINLVFGLIALFRGLPTAAAITAVSLSGTGLAAVFIVNLITGIQNLNGVLDSPQGYTFALVPVKSSKILFARIAAVVVQDMLTLFLNIFGVVWLSLYLGGLTIKAAQDYITQIYLSEISQAFLLSFIYYLFIYMFAVFCNVLKNSIFFNKKLKTLLTIVSSAVLFWLLSLVDFVLVPFAVVDNYWFWHFNLTLYDTLGITIHIILVLAKTAGLFIVTSRLMDRRMNYG